MFRRVVTMKIRKKKKNSETGAIHRDFYTGVRRL